MHHDATYHPHTIANVVIVMAAASALVGLDKGEGGRDGKSALGH
jgi:hypothetical protein